VRDGAKWAQITPWPPAEQSPGQAPAAALTSCSDMSLACWTQLSTGFRRMKPPAMAGSGGMSTVTLAGRSEKLHGRPKSLRFRVYT